MRATITYGREAAIQARRPDVGHYGVEVGESVGCRALGRLEHSIGVPLWSVCAILFVAAWIGQFIGHAIEGRRPSFFKDVQFLMIGPLWLLADLYRRLGIRF